MTITRIEVPPFIGSSQVRPSSSRTASWQRDLMRLPAYLAEKTAGETACKSIRNSRWRKPLSQAFSNHQP
jgi:hypothetical protein